MNQTVNICNDMACVIFNETGESIRNTVLDFGLTKKYLRNGKRNAKCVLEMTQENDRLEFDIFIGDPYIKGC